MDGDPDILAAANARPRDYVCYRCDGPLVIDGRAREEIWRAAPWSEDFADIRGVTGPRPRHKTRVRMLHDDRFLYVHAELEEPHVRGTITRRNAVVFHDNDFEVFIDPDGDNHDYYELEVNALNTVWELSLPRPYRADGTPRDPDPLNGLATAVHVDGTINDPSDVDRGWSVQLAIPFEGLSRFTGEHQACPPADGDQWRVNFSRVQWAHDIVDGRYEKIDGVAEDNWVWSPQGVVDMHRPATWGTVQFSCIVAGHGTIDVRPDPLLDARNAIMASWEQARRDGTLVTGWSASTTVETPAGACTIRVDEHARLSDDSAGPSGVQ